LGDQLTVNICDNYELINYNKLDGIYTFTVLTCSLDACIVVGNF